jgi:hypothetical protein
MKINYCSSPCSAGKTHAIINQACKLADQGKRVLVVQPTKHLIDRTVDTELRTRSNPPPFKVLYGSSILGDRSVTKKFMDHLKGPDADGGNITFVTHQLLPHVPFFPHQRLWHVFIDEAPQVHDHVDFQVPHTHSILTEHLETKTYNAIYGSLVCSNRSAVESIAKNADNDKLIEQFSPIARFLINRNWDSFVNTEHFDQLIRGERQHLVIHWLLNPSFLDGFKSVLITAANFEDSDLYRLWSEQHVHFVEDTMFADQLRFKTHQNGSLITIRYCHEHPWTRSFKEKVWNDNDTSSTLNLMARSVKVLFGNDKFVWQGNHRDAELLKGLFGSNERLPNLPHGLNDYQDI